MSVETLVDNLKIVLKYTNKVSVKGTFAVQPNLKRLFFIIFFMELLLLLPINHFAGVCCFPKKCTNTKKAHKKLKLNLNTRASGIKPKTGHFCSHTVLSFLFSFFEIVQQKAMF